MYYWDALMFPGLPFQLSDVRTSEKYCFLLFFPLIAAAITNMLVDITIYCTQIMSVLMHYFKVILKNFEFDELTFLSGVKHIKCYYLALMLCAGYIFLHIQNK